MKFFEALKLCADSPYAYGYADFSGKIFISWGSAPLAPKVLAGMANSAANEGSGHSSLQFGDFYSGAKENPDWKKFSLGSFAEFSSAEVLAEAASSPDRKPLFGKIQNRLPDEREWKLYCKKIEAGISSGKFAKIVPARSEVWDMPELTSLAILQRLFTKPDGKTVRFFLSWAGELFFGASPELLFEQRRGELYIPCIAGTKVFDPLHPLSVSEKQQFLADGKERAEHLLVVRGILEALQVDPKSITIPEPSLLELPGLVHLFTPLHLPGEKNLESLVRLLHPTPAVGGYPQKAALEFLAEEEPWPRGKFAGPLLYQDSQGATAVVAIRSALFAKNQLTFFAGAGYVKGSTPEKEWLETEKKMQFLKNILAITGESHHGN
jgi:isochorismate synthase EntC